MGIYTEEIKKFAVKVTYDKDDSCGDGSGVLVKINDNTCYVITAKHNFKVGVNETYKDVDVKNLQLNLDKIKINKDIEKNICTIDNIIYQDDRYDILIFSTSNWTNYIENLDKVHINLTYSHTYEYYCFYGYPIDKEGTPSKKMEHHGYRGETEEYILRLDRVQSSNDDAVTGFSGSGIFGKNKNDNKFYLVGIFTEFEDDHEFYYGIDFIRIFDEVDRKLICPQKNYEQSYTFHRGDYIEPRTVYIKELKIHVAVCPVTFEEYDLCFKDNDKCYAKDYEYKSERNNLPVVNVSWECANKYIEWLNDKTNKEYSLLSSKEWDYISQKDKLEEFLSDYIWHKNNTEDKKIQHVGKKKSGNLGIFDLYGNIHEWCSDKRIRGNSFKYSLNDIFKMIDRVHLPKHTKDVLGFRIAIRSM